jgi:hypothetical protein
MKSPLKSKPLRNPGQSVDEHIQDLVDDVIPYIFGAVAFFVFALLEWHRWATNSSPSPVIMTVIAVPLMLYAARRIIVTRKKIKALKLGRDGEMAVGQYLESLRENGAKVFHDIQGEGFNLDHVVIDKSGIYVIETKTFSKPDKGQTVVTYDGEKVFVNGKEPDRNPVIQVRAACRWLKELLRESTGKDCNPRPVVVFPGWFVEPTAEAKNSDVWVLNPKALPSFISHSKPQLESDEVAIFSYHLSRHVRAEGAK